MLRQHAIDPVRFFVDILREQNATTRIDFIGRPHGGRNQRQIAANQSPPRPPRADGPYMMFRPKGVCCRWICYGPERLGSEQRLPVPLLCKRRELRCCDRPMESYQSRFFVDRQMESGDVAESNEDLGIPADQIVIDSIEQLSGAISAADRQYATHLRIGEHRVQVVQPLCYGAAQIPCLLPNIFAPLRLQAEVLNSALDQLKLVGIGDVGGGRDQSDGIALMQGARAQKTLVRSTQFPCRQHGRPHACKHFSASHCAVSAKLDCDPESVTRCTFNAAVSWATKIVGGNGDPPSSSGKFISFPMVEG